MTTKSRDMLSEKLKKLYKAKQAKTAELAQLHKSELETINKIIAITEEQRKARDKMKHEST